MQHVIDPDLAVLPMRLADGPSLLVTCAGCDRLHAASDCLAFTPTCPTCSGSYPLGALGMDGSFALTHATIDRTVTRTSAGNYALGYLDGSRFVVFYVGRADSDLGGRLHEWVDTPSRYRKYSAPTRAAWGRRRRGSLPLAAPASEVVELAVDSSYTRFAYSYAVSAEAAFAKECRNYDQFGGSDALDNPDDPTETPTAPQ